MVNKFATVISLQEHLPTNILGTSLVKRMFMGAAIALGITAVFLSTLKGPSPQWNCCWMVKPLVIVPLTGAIGSGMNHVMFHFRDLFGFNRTTEIILNVLVYLIGLWFGMALGFDGILWY